MSKINRFEISISNNQDIININIDDISEIVNKMLNFICEKSDLVANSALKNIAIKQYSFSVDIVFCDDNEIKELNSSYREKDVPTDVLSFALFADNPDENFIFDNHIVLGEVIISVETAQKQASERQNSFEYEINFLLSHGILHLLGFDHPDEKTLDEMLSIQEKMILASV